MCLIINQEVVHEIYADCMDEKGNLIKDEIECYKIVKKRFFDERPEYNSPFLHDRIPNIGPYTSSRYTRQSFNSCRTLFEKEKNGEITIFLGIHVFLNKEDAQNFKECLIYSWLENYIPMPPEESLVTIKCKAKLANMVSAGKFAATLEKKLVITEADNAVFTEIEIVGECD